MEEEVFTLDNVYKLLLSFDKIYDIMSDKEKKDLISYLIKDIQVYSNEEQVEMRLATGDCNAPCFQANTLFRDRLIFVMIFLTYKRRTN